MKKSMWRIQAGAVLNGIILLTLAALAGSVCDGIASVNDKVDLARSFMTGNFKDYFEPDMWDYAQWMLLLLEVFGYFLYFGGLKRFASLLQSNDASQVMRVRTGAILTLIGSVIGHVPVLGWLPKLVLVIIGFVKMLGGYKSLKYSSTFPGTQGASTLHSALIVQLVGVILGLLPLVGGILESIADIIVFFMVVSGWSTIKNVVPTASVKSLPEVSLLPYRKVPGGLLLAWGLGGYFALSLVGSLIAYLSFYFKLFIDPNDIETYHYYESLASDIRYYGHYGYYIALAAFVVYIVGIGRASFYRSDRKIKGIALVITGLSIIAVMGPLQEFADAVFYDNVIRGLLESDDFSKAVLLCNILYACCNFLRCIAWSVCAIGFIRIGRTGHYGYLGKYGVNFLQVAAWIHVGGCVAWIARNVWGGGTQYSVMCVSTLNLLLSVVCFILQWNGWRHLLSSWYGERDPELPAMSVVVPGASGMQEVFICGQACSRKKGGEEEELES
ncbi:MAG: hypothetical protein NC410_00415 [Oscillibacter sp.]|nr:hypothetical protein [Oscillibacter sp.]